jgi:hypothetical protein
VKQHILQKEIITVDILRQLVCFVKFHLR